jgi:hypothetical protein
VSKYEKEKNVTTFVPKGNQSPKIDTTEETSAEVRESAPISVTETSLNPFPGWRRPDDEFVVDL